MDKEKSIVDMTPEELLDYVECLYDPPLTPERREWYLRYMRHETDVPPWEWPEVIE